jgi:hypothetical protein
MTPRLDSYAVVVALDTKQVPAVAAKPAYRDFAPEEGLTYGVDPCRTLQDFRIVLISNVESIGSGRV